MPTLPPLDSRTAYAALSLIAAFTVAISLNAAQVMSDVRRPLRAWAAGMGSAAAAFLLYYLRGVAPDLLTHGVANLLMVVIAVQALRAHAQLLDLDHFKRVNDEHGHLAGDQVLVHAARQLLAGVRAGDLVARYGGEEFCILLPGCDLAQARRMAQRLVEQARAAPVRLRDGRTIAYRWSVGCAAAPDAAAIGTSELEGLLARADEALLTAKTGGRDRVECAATAPGPLMA